MADTAPSPDAVIRAMPNAWAHPLTFAQAVLDDAHFLHQWAIGQWRGLLTLCALQNLYAEEYSVSVLPVPLDAANPVAQALLDCAPTTGMATGQGLWRAPILLQAHRPNWPDCIMGQINPLCLLSPSRGLSAEWPCFAWMSQGLCDPLRAPIPPPVTDLAVMASWLSVLEGALAAQNDPIGTQLHGRVRAFREDCLFHMGDLSIEVDSTGQASWPLPAPFTALFTQSRIAAIADPAGMAMGRLAVDLHLPDAGPNVVRFKGVILADMALTQIYGLDARHILIWGTRTLAELLNNAALMADIQAQAAEAGWLILTTDDLFTRRMVRLNRQAVIASHPDELNDCLLPIRPMALILGERLPDMIHCALVDGGATVTLLLPLEDGRLVPLSRTFMDNPAAGQGEYVAQAEWQIHAASIWPDFKSDRFEYYAARLIHNDSYAQREYVCATSVLSRSLWLNAMADCGRVQDAMEVFRTVNAGGALPEAHGRLYGETISQNGEQERIWRAHMPFEAVSWHDRSDGRAEEFCGLLLLTLPDMETRTSPVQVAVDFGTTNTVACFDDRAPITFADRLVIPIQSENTGLTAARLHDKRFVYNKFFPRGSRNLPTPSVALSRPNAGHGLSEGVFRNIIFFPGMDAQAANGEAKELQLLSRDIAAGHFNLKWSEQMESNRATRDYLDQLIWMIAAEAVARGHDPAHLQWRFSVPDAMPLRRKENFERMLSQLIDRIGGARESYGRTAPRLAPLISEGLAAASHMLAGGDEATQKLLTIIIDIGGGTSDIAIWDGNDVRWKGSLRLAGQDFFTPALTRNPQILDDIGLGFWGRMLGHGDVLDGIGRETVPHIAELLFSDDRLQTAIDTHWDSHLNRESGAVLRMAGLTYLGGMAWYLGRVAQALQGENALHYGASSTPAFALCGRGAGVFKKIHGPLGATGISDATGALSLFSISAELDDEPRPQIFLQRDAKLEVVRGMMTDAPRLRAAAANWHKKAGEAGAIASFTPAGLSVHYADGGALPAYMPFDAATDLGRALHIGFDEFDTFLKALSHATGVYIDVRPGVAQAAWDRIEHAVLARLEDVRHDPSALSPEPPFITALRQLLHEVIDPNARGEGRIIAEFIG